MVGGRGTDPEKTSHLTGGYFIKCHWSAMQHGQLSLRRKIIQMTARLLSPPVALRTLVTDMNVPPFLQS